MFGIGDTEILIIVVVAVLLFGGNKISQIARGMGRFTGEFKKGQAEMDAELSKLKNKDKQV